MTKLNPVQRKQRPSLHKPCYQHSSKECHSSNASVTSVIKTPEQNHHHSRKHHHSSTNATAATSPTSKIVFRLVMTQIADMLGWWNQKMIIALQ
jgi:hypothetical protein